MHLGPEISATVQWNGFFYFHSKDNRSCQFWRADSPDCWKYLWILVWFRLKWTLKIYKHFGKVENSFCPVLVPTSLMGCLTLVLRVSYQRQHQRTHLPLSEKIRHLHLQAAIPQPINPPHILTWFSCSAYTGKGPIDFWCVTGIKVGTSRFGQHKFCK